MLLPGAGHLTERRWWLPGWRDTQAPKDTQPLLGMPLKAKKEGKKDPDFSPPAPSCVPLVKPIRKQLTKEPGKCSFLQLQDMTGTSQPSTLPKHSSNSAVLSNKLYRRVRADRKQLQHSKGKLNCRSLAITAYYIRKAGPLRLP